MSSGAGQCNVAHLPPVPGRAAEHMCGSETGDLYGAFFWARVGWARAGASAAFGGSADGETSVAAERGLRAALCAGIGEGRERNSRPGAAAANGLGHRGGRGGACLGSNVGVGGGREGCNMSRQRGGQ